MNSATTIAPPPQLTYTSLGAAKLAIETHARANAYAVSVKHTRRVGNKAGDNIKAIVFCCCNAGAPVLKAQKCRTASRKTGCNFRVSVLKQAEVFQVLVDVADHNHEPFAHASAHPSGRPLTLEQQASVISLGRAGVTPSRIVASLRQQDSNVNVIAQDIYNLRRAHKVEFLSGRSPLAAFLDSLAVAKVEHFFEINNQNQLSHLFIVSTSARAICEQFSRGKIWLIDATYKTNRYGLPLLHIIGVTATNTSFTFGYCFMKSESMADYTWALTKLKDVFRDLGLFAPYTFVTDRELALMNALSEIFPDCSAILCRWHINKNIFAKHRGSFASAEDFAEFMKAWNLLIYAPTEFAYDTRLRELNRLAPLHVINYVTTTWLIHKERFVSAWMRSRHFGHTSTSRVESAHAAHKRWIAVSTGDLLDVDTAIKLACDGQLATIQQQNAKERAITNMQLGPMFSAVVGKVSVAGLRGAHKQYCARNETLDECHGHLRATLGYPCSHDFRMRNDNPLRSIIPLQIEDFDPHWWLKAPTIIMPEPRVAIPMADALKRIRDEYEAEVSPHRKQLMLERVLAWPAGETIQEPRRIQGRGRPSGSTARLPSHFEHVASVLEAEAGSSQRRCRVCRRSGHNAQTCGRVLQIQNSNVNSQ